MRVRKSLFQRVMCDFNSVVGNLVIIIVDSCSSTAVVTFVKTTKQSSSHILWPRYCSRLAFWHLPLLSALLDQSSLAKLHDRNDICYIKKPALFAPIFFFGGGGSRQIWSNSRKVTCQTNRWLCICVILSLCIAHCSVARNLCLFMSIERPSVLDDAEELPGLNHLLGMSLFLLLVGLL